MHALNGLGPSDESLMARAQDGDADAFGELYDRHAPRVFQVAQAICGDIDRAENALREGFLAIWRSRAQFDPESGSFKAWSTRVVVERAIGTEIPSGTVKGRMRLGLEKLREQTGTLT